MTRIIPSPGGSETQVGLALIGGVVVLLLIAALVRVLRRGRTARIGSPEDAAAAADAALSGFETLGAVVGGDGAGALAVDRAGRVAAMTRRGPRILVREVAWQALRSTAEGIVIDTGDHGIGTVLVTGVDALDVRRLAPADLRRMIH